MIEFVETNPEVRVEPSEYQRLLGYPPDFVLEGRAQELSEWARDWYREHGRPWIYARRADTFDVTGSAVRIDGAPFNSARLQKTLQEAEADRLYMVAVGAGPEAEEKAQRLWREEKPDEYFFLEIYGSAVVEHLVTLAGARLCAWADTRGLAVLPHYSPGYSEWDIAEQSRLLRLIQRNGKSALPGALEALESGALRPKKSLLGVFGVTPHVDRVRRLADLVPCEQCSLANCQFRRTPYLRARRAAETVAIAAAPEAPSYTVNAKALKRWAAERLILESTPDGTLRARFRYDGTTCTNMGRPLTYVYEVTLSRGEDGYIIREQHCGPASGDTGHTAMCQYISNPEALNAAVSRERPLLGMPLERVLSWHRAANAAGCYCDAASREHKWGLVLETIHYALHNNQTNGNHR